LLRFALGSPESFGFPQVFPQVWKTLPGQAMRQKAGESTVRFRIETMAETKSG